jgi:hypothetical protein
MENPKNNITEKFCNHCNISHNIEDFYKSYTKFKLENGDINISISYVCKIYKKNHKKDYFLKNKEVILKKARASAKENRIKNHEIISQKRREYYAKNSKKLCQKSIEYAKKNKEKVKKRENIYRKNNKEKIAEREKKLVKTETGFINNIIAISKSEDIKKNRECDVDMEYLKELLAKQNQKCFFCNHILDIGRGYGTLSQASLDRANNALGHIKGNVNWTCVFCNFAKNSNSNEIFKLFLDILLCKKDIEDLEYNEKKFHASSLLRNCIKSDNRAKRDTINLMTCDDIYDIIKNQNNKCAITGLSLIKTDQPKFPFQPSIDRIKNDIGHTKDNCQIVCLAIQFGKHKHTNEAVKNYIAELKEINKN